MIPYLVVFLIGVLATMLAQKNLNNKFLFFFYSLVAILLPSVLAGFRDETVGTDVVNYPVACYNIAEHFDSLFLTLVTSQSEPIFTLLVYWGYLKGDLSWSLFFVQLFTMSFMYIAIYMYHDKLKMWKAYMIFMFLFYNMSLNLMRQTMALSVCMLSYVLMIKGKSRWCILTLVLALLCHSSSVIFIIPLLLYQYMVVKKKRIPYYFFLVILLAVVLLKPITSFIISIGVLSQHYLAYIEDPTSMFSLTNVMSQFLLFLFMKLLSNQIENKGRYMAYVLTIAFMSLIFIGVSMVSMWSCRIAFFFEILYVINFPYLLLLRR